MPSKPIAVLPDRSQWMPCTLVASPHPAVIATDDLLRHCDLRTQRRSGPGGQHRNKTSSGAFLTHRPSKIVGEATERRSQQQNREVALLRLRFQLAIELRSPSPLDPDVDVNCDIEYAIRQRYRKSPLRLNDSNADKPSVLTLVLNDLWVAGGQPSLVANEWAVSTSKLVAFLKSHPVAVSWVNRVRDHHDRLPLH